MVHETRSAVIRIRCESRKVYDYLDPERSPDSAVWYQCLVKAAKLHESKQGTSSEVLQLVEKLKMDPNDKISQKTISKAYRKLCLRVIFSAFLLPAPAI